MPRGATPTRLDEIQFQVFVEDAPFPLVRVQSDVPPEQRAGFAGPLGEHAELLDEVVTLANHRARMRGAQHSYGAVHSWRMLTQVWQEDLTLVVEGLQRLLTGDPGLLRVFVSLPPITSSVGNEWASPIVRAHPL